MYLSQKKNVKKWSDSDGFKDTAEWIVETDGKFYFNLKFIRRYLCFF